MLCKSAKIFQKLSFATWLIDDVYTRGRGPVEFRFIVLLRPWNSCSSYFHGFYRWKRLDLYL